jgi:16S rRNA (guanine527-N7)-methyltransferase
MISDLSARAGRRLEELAAEYELTEPTVTALTALLDVLARDPHAPTTVREPTAAVDRHVADSLVALRFDEVLEARAIADLGAGAGFPGLVLAAALPEAHVWLIESSARKCEFIRRAIAAAGLRNAVPVAERAESWIAGRSLQDVVTARAVAPLNVVAEYAAPLLREGGTLIAWTGRRDAIAEAEALAAAEVLGMRVGGPVAVSPFPGADHRHLHLMSKVRDTPSEFPRRAGIARKRPLGGGARSSDRARR